MENIITKQKDITNTIKPNELMLGDYIAVEHVKGNIVNIKIDFINTVMVEGTQVSNSKLMGRGSCDKLFPIPLTPEILKKNGFKKVERDEYNEYIWEKIDETDYYRIEIWWRDSYDNGVVDAFNVVRWDKQWNMFIEGNGYNLARTGCKPIYVHELQHAMRLCKIDKEIIL